MSKERISPEAGFVSSKRPRGPNGRQLCRKCNVEVPKGRITFCSEECIHEWKLRTQPGYVRDQIRKRDHGICVICKVDTIELKKNFFEPNVSSLYNRMCRPEQYRKAKELGYSPARNEWWDADHIVPVCEGGGECGLDNYRTLCQPCHKKVTAELSAKRAAERRAKKDKDE